MSDLEQRLFFLEQLMARVDYSLQQLRQQSQGLANQQRQGSWGQGGSGGASAAYFSCTLSGALAHGSSIAGQSVWKMPGRATAAASATVYNDGPNAADDIATGKQVILAANSDGSYTAIGVYC
jgi:hypothetical protein